MERDERPETGQCPSFDDLSAWHDAAHSDPALDLHIRRCPACQSALHTMECLDLAIQEHIEDLGPDARSLERMMGTIQRQVNLPRYLLLHLPALTRFAAGLAVVIAVVVAFNLSTAPHETLARVEATPVERAIVLPTDDLLAESSQMVNDQLIASLPALDRDSRLPAPLPAPAPAGEVTPVVATDLPGFGLSASRGMPTIEGSSPLPMATAPMDDIQLLGTYVPPAVRLEETPMTFVSQANQTIGDQVRHVWVLDDPRVALRELQLRMPRHRQGLQALIEQNLDEYVLQLTIADRDLQQLVDKFEQLGMKLYSPTAPQPGMADNLRFNNRSIRYEVDLVRP